MKTRPLAGSIALAAVIATTLSGCFMIPVLDGRSPFDDPFGVSTGQLERAIPELQAALDEAPTHPDWELLADSSIGNCEGPCNLRLVATMKPSDALLRKAVDQILAEREPPEEGVLGEHFSTPPTENVSVDLVVPDEVWRSTAATAIRAAEKLGMDVTVRSAAANELLIEPEAFRSWPNECPAVKRALNGAGSPGAAADPEQRFEVLGSAADSSCSVRFATADSSGLEAELGLTPTG